MTKFKDDLETEYEKRSAIFDETNWNTKFTDLEWLSDVRYDGFVQNGRHHGFGTKLFLNGDLYYGEWYQGEKRGFGIYVFKNGDKYEGEFKGHTYHGIGKFTMSNKLHGNFGNQYIGFYENGKQHGKGFIHFCDGEIYEGIWDHGRITRYFNRLIIDIGIGRKSLEGQYEDDHQSDDENVCFISKSGDIFTGKVKNNRILQGVLNQKNGDKLHYKDSKLIGYSTRNSKKIFQNIHLFNVYKIWNNLFAR